MSLLIKALKQAEKRHKLATAEALAQTAHELVAVPTSLTSMAPGDEVTAAPAPASAPVTASLLVTASAPIATTVPATIAEPATLMLTTVESVMTAATSTAPVIEQTGLQTAEQPFHKSATNTPVAVSVPVLMPLAPVAVPLAIEPVPAMGAHLVSPPVASAVSTATSSSAASSTGPTSTTAQVRNDGRSASAATASAKSVPRRARLRGRMRLQAWLIGGGVSAVGVIVVGWLAWSQSTRLVPTSIAMPVQSFEPKLQPVQASAANSDKADALSARGDNTDRGDRGDRSNRSARSEPTERAARNERSAANASARNDFTRSDSTKPVMRLATAKPSGSRLMEQRAGESVTATGTATNSASMSKSPDATPAAASGSSNAQSAVATAPVAPSDKRGSELAAVKLIRSESQYEKTAGLLDSGYQAMLNNDMSTAKRWYEQALALDRNSADALVGLATISSRNDQPLQAERLYRRALEVDPNEPGARAGLIALRRLVDPTAQESALRSMIAGENATVANHVALGNLLAAQGRWPEAQQSYFQATSAEPNHPDYAFNLAVSLDRMRQGSAAIGAYRRAIELANARPARFHVAQVQTRLAELEERAVAKLPIAPASPSVHSDPINLSSTPVDSNDRTRQ